MPLTVFIGNDTTVTVPNVQKDHQPQLVAPTSFVWKLYDEDGAQVGTGAVGLVDTTNDFRFVVPGADSIGLCDRTAGKIVIAFTDNGADALWQDSVGFLKRKLNQ
jgi:hypothetical protein